MLYSIRENMLKIFPQSLRWMMRLLAGYLYTWLVLIVCTPIAIADSQDELKKGVDAFLANDYAESISLLTTTLENHELEANDLGIATYLRGLAYWIKGDTENASKDLNMAVASLDNPAFAISARAKLNFEIDQQDVGLADIMDLAENYPDRLIDFELRFMWRVDGWLEEEKRSDDRYAFLNALAGAGYNGTEPGQNADYLYQELLIQMMERGDNFNAVQLIRRITETKVLVRLRMDRQFESLWERGEFESATDVSAAIFRKLSHARAEMARFPNQLSAVTNLVRSLRFYSDPEQAVETGMAALQNLETYQQDKNDELWLTNEISYALFESGKYEEGNALLRDLIQRRIEENQDLVNQYINFGVMLLEQGLYDDALDVVSRVNFRFASPYGEKIIQYVQVCAYSETGEMTKGADIMSEMLIRPHESFLSVIDALLCLNRTDDAANYMVQALESTQWRSGALYSLMDYEPYPYSMSFRDKQDLRFEKIRAAENVQNTLNRYGRVISIPLPTSAF